MKRDFYRFGPGTSQLDQAPIDNALKDIWDAILAMPRTKIIYGIAMSPQVHAHLRATNWNTSPRMDDHVGMFAGAPFIVDSRLTEKSEVFYDNAKWQDRVKEQNAHDIK